MAQVAGTQPFPMAITSIIWSTDTCITSTTVIATTMVKSAW
jgi:hypothetical protein